tara:strand:+ start:93 stop:494 length:402 start_codon:yes stop_codon:yes gene_type:complete
MADQLFLEEMAKRKTCLKKQKRLKALLAGIVHQQTICAHDTNHSGGHHWSLRRYRVFISDRCPTTFVYGAESETVYQTAKKLSWWYRLLAPAYGGLAIGFLVHFYLAEERSQGVTDTIEALANKEDNISLQDY